MNRFRVALVALALLVVAAVIYGVSRPASDTASVTGAAANSPDLIPVDQRPPAPEFVGLDGWLNSNPLTLSQLKGKVVLVDFWTFSCVNCVRTFPYERALYDKYKSSGFDLIGMHSPEFDFEKDKNNVAAAVKKDDVTWPVALDSEMATWDAYQNQYWPAEYLIDQQGRIAYENFGEGNYAQTELAVATLLGQNAATPSAGPPTSDASAITPEIYVGSDRGQDYGLSNGESYAAEGTKVTYPSGQPTTPDHVLLTGSWVDHGSYVTAASSAHVLLSFHATNVYIVAGTETSGSKISVIVDGAPVSAQQLGTALDSSGSTTIKSSELYQLLQGQDPGHHTINIAVPAGFQLYTFTFG